MIVTYEVEHAGTGKRFTVHRPVSAAREAGVDLGTQLQPGDELAVANGWDELEELD